MVTALKNEPRMLIFEGGNGGDVAGKEQPLSKTSTMLVFEGGGGGGVGKEQPPWKTAHGLLLWR